MNYIKEEKTMIKLNKVDLMLEGTLITISENLKDVYSKEERIGVLSCSYKDRKKMLINGIELFKLPEGGNLAEDFLKHGWKEKGWSNFTKKLTEEQNRQIEVEWLRVSSEFDNLLLQGKLEIKLTMPKEQTNIYSHIENCPEFDLKYYWEEKYDLTAWYKLPKALQEELVEKREVIITEWALQEIKRVDEIREAEKIRIEGILEKQEEEVKKAFKEELLVYSDDVILARAGNTLLHSMGIRVSRGRINFYTTYYAKEIQGKTTYDIKEVLKQEGYRFDPEEKYWWKENTEENLKKALEILQENDTKADPIKLGYSQCWECGCWRKHLDMSGYCGC